MHELGTIYYVMKTVENLAAENKLTKVGSITLEVGEVSGIVPEFLTDFWEYARKKNDLFRDTELKIETLHAITYWTAVPPGCSRRRSCFRSTAASSRSPSTSSQGPS